MKADGSDAGAKAPAKRNKAPTIADVIRAQRDQIAMALPKHLSADRLFRIALTAVRTNPRLGSCSQASLLGGLMQAAQLGLEPNTPLGQAYLIPRYSKKVGGYEAAFQLGYRGVLDLCYRSGAFRRITAMTVYEGDDFRYRLGTDPILEHVPGAGTGEATHYYALYETKDGGLDFRVWPREKVEAHAKKYSDSYTKDYSPWKTSFDAMALKTVLLDVLRYAPRSIESDLARGIAVDDGVATFRADDPDASLDLDLTPTTNDGAGQLEGSNDNDGNATGGSGAEGSGDA
ncbi:MAG: recombinase RecT [Spirochaetota bacterium]